MRLNRDRLFIPKILLAVIAGAAGTWMLLGTYPIWLKFAPVTQVGSFIAVFFISSACFYCLCSLNWQLLNKIQNHKTKITLLIAFLLLSFLISIGFRHEIPISFSYPFSPQQIAIIQPTDTSGCSVRPTSIDFDISIKPGMITFHPFIREDGICQSNGQPLVRYVFFMNRLTAKAMLRFTGSLENPSANINATTIQNPMLIDFSKSEKDSVTLVLTDKQIDYYAVYAIDLAFSSFCMVLLFGLGWRLLSAMKKTGISLLRLTARIFAIYTQKSTIVKVLPVFLLIAAISLFAETALHALIWFLSLSSVILTTLLLLAILKIKNWPAFVIGFFVLSYANVLLVTQGAGLAGVLDHSLALVGFHFLIMTVVIFLYCRAKKPPILPMLKKYTEEEILARLIGFSQQNPEIILLFAATSVVYLVIGVLIVLVPSNIDDILTTYLPRAGFWVQQGSFNVWPVSEYNLPQIVYPLNGQLPLAWLINLWGNADLAGFLQYLSLPMGCAGIYGLVKIIGGSPKQSLFAALIFLGLPEIIIQSSTALTDLLVADFIVAGIFLLLSGIEGKKLTFLSLSALSIGITAGIKQTVFFIFPGLAVLVILMLIKYGKKFCKPIGLWITFSLLAFLLFSSFGYLQNKVNYGNYLGPSELTSYFTHTDASKSDPFILSGVNNMGKLVVRSLVDNLPSSVRTSINQLIIQLPTSDVHVLDEYLSRDLYTFSLAWCGQIGSLMLMVVFFFALIHSIRKKNWIMLGIFFIVLSYTLLLMFVRTFSIVSASTRYLVSVVILLIPLNYLITRQKWVRILLVTNSIMMMTVTLLFDGAKPLVGKNAIWGMSQNELRSLQFEQTLPAFNSMDKYLPEDATVGFILPKKFPQSYLFGEDYTRKVVQFAPQEDSITLSELQNQGVEYLLIETGLIEKGFDLPELTMLTNDPELSFNIYLVPDTHTGEVQ